MPPTGKRPEGAKFSKNGVGRSDKETKPKIPAIPIKINKITATIFIPANQYSASAKPLVVNAFNVNKSTMNTAHQIQVGLWGNHCFINIPAAVNSTPAVAAEPTKYIHPSEKPAEGTIYSAAYF